ncbi:MAG: SMC-Scp complex subunit ScpB [Acidimicrobiales bacterium]
MSESEQTEPEVAAELAPRPEVSIAEAKRAIEAMVLVSTDPLAEHLLAQLIEIPVTLVRELCHELAASYASERRGFQLVEVANGWRFQTHPDLSPYIERYVLEGQTTRLSTAALETLAIVAYKQPISRAQVSAIRGVNVDGVLRTLVHRGYLAEVGRDDGPGQAVLFGTTSSFLEKLGIASIDQLPPLGDFVPGAHVVEALEQTLRVDRSQIDPVADLAADDLAVEDPAAEGPAAVDERPDDD